MILVKEYEKKTVIPTTTTTIHEYETASEDISGAVAEINGRYPESGFASNTKSKELVYVISGTGKIINQQGEKELSAGDVVFIDNEEEFAWFGNMVIFMATAPQFNPNEHLITEDS